MPNPWSLVSGYRKNAAVGASLPAKVVREQARSHTKNLLLLQSRGLFQIVFSLWELNLPITTQIY